MATPGPSAHLLSRWPLRSIWPWVVLLLGVAFSTFLWLRVRMGEQVRLEALHRVQAKAVVDQLKGRMAGLEEVLLGAAGYLGRGSLPSRSEWRGFVGDHHFASTYPGVQGFGFVEWVPRDRLGAHIRQLQQEGFADYQVLPGGSLPPDPEGLSPILYLEPMNERNQRAFARDMLRDPTRREALLRARDTGRVSLTGPVTLYQESGTDIQTGVVLLAPVYRQDEPHDTVDQRRRALRGWASYPLRLRDFTQAVLSRDLSMMDLELCDGDGSNLSGRLFSYGAPQDRSGAAASLVQVIDVAGRTWTVRLQPNARFYAGVGHHEHWEFLAGGLFISLLLFTLLVAVQGAEARARALAHQRGEELLASESQFRMISENVGDVVWVLGLDPIHCEFVSPSVMQARGLSPEEVMAEPWENALTPDSLAKVQRLMSERIPAFRADDPGTWAYTDEVDQVRKDGTVFPTEVTTRFLSDSQGKVVRVIGVSRDITDRRKGEDALRQSESRFRSVVENAGDAIYLNDEEGRIFLCNRAACRNTGYAMEDLLHLRIGELDPEFLDPRNVAARRNLQAGQVISIQSRHRRKDGSSFPVEVRIALFKAEEPRQILAVVRDLSEREQMQESELRARKAESLVLMAGGIAHDFNNLFQSIQGNLEIASMLSEGQPSLAKPLNRAMGILDKAVGLSWKMLDFSGHGFVHPDHLQLEDWLPAYLATLRPDFPPDFHWNLTCEPVPPIKGDPSKLEQVVRAILDNAWEAAGSGRGQAHLRLFLDLGRDRPGPGSLGTWPLKWPGYPATVCLEISDDGPGVAPEQLSLICDPFYTSKEPGRGLGLPVVVGILTAHRAGLHIMNGEEKGLILRMHFPPAET